METNFQIPETTNTDEELTALIQKTVAADDISVEATKAMMLFRHKPGFNEWELANTRWFKDRYARVTLPLSVLEYMFRRDYPNGSIASMHDPDIIPQNADRQAAIVRIWLDAKDMPVGRDYGFAAEARKTCVYQRIDLEHETIYEGEEEDVLFKKAVDYAKAVALGQLGYGAGYFTEIERSNQALDEIAKAVHAEKAEQVVKEEAAKAVETVTPDADVAEELPAAAGRASQKEMAEKLLSQFDDAVSVANEKVRKANAESNPVVRDGLMADIMSEDVPILDKLLEQLYVKAEKGKNKARGVKGNKISEVLNYTVIASKVAALDRNVQAQLSNVKHEGTEDTETAPIAAVAEEVETVASVQTPEAEPTVTVIAAEPTEEPASEPAAETEPVAEMTAEPAEEAPAASERNIDRYFSDEVQDEFRVACKGRKICDMEKGLLRFMYISTKKSHLTAEDYLDIEAAYATKATPEEVAQLKTMKGGR